ncbi:MAG: DUF499 domain-containing protein, partial [Gammaproteobacteria bacterium]
PDLVLRNKIIEFVGRGDFGLASGRDRDGGYERIWFEESVAPVEVAFEAGVSLLRKATAQMQKSAPPPEFVATSEAESKPDLPPEPTSEPFTKPTPGFETTTLRLVGTVPPEVWNRLGTRILPKLRSGSNLRVGLDLSVTVKSESAASLSMEIREILAELGLAETVRVD